jgi:hypothetical protein
MRSNITQAKWDSKTHEFLGPKCYVGQRLYMPYETLIIPVEVVEIEDIYASDCGVFEDAGENCSIWMWTSKEGRRASQGSKEIDESGWNVFLPRDPDEVLTKCKLVNQYVWLDEPIGHSVQLGDEVFLKIVEALQFIRPTNKKHLRRRLKQYRNNVHRFVAHTWKMNGARHPGFERLPNKKVYVRRG